MWSSYEKATEFIMYLNMKLKLALVAKQNYLNLLHDDLDHTI